MIIYTVICRARDAAVLVEESSPELAGNAPQVTAMLLSHLKDNPHLVQEGERKTFVQKNMTEDDFLSYFIESCSVALGEESAAEEHYFHLLSKSGVYFCCIGDDPDFRDQKVNFAFLDQIATEFLKRHRQSRIENANAYALDKSFRPTVRSAVHYHNINHKSIAREERVQKLMAKVEDMRRVMGVSINLLLERGEKLERLVQQSDELEEDARIFQKKSAHVKRIQQRKYYFKWLLLASISTVVISIFLYVCMVAVCGSKFQYCRRGGVEDGATQGGDGDENFFM